MKHHNSLKRTPFCLGIFGRPNKTDQFGDSPIPHPLTAMTPPMQTPSSPPMDHPDLEGPQQPIWSPKTVESDPLGLGLSHHRRAISPSPSVLSAAYRVPRRAQAAILRNNSVGFCLALGKKPEPALTWTLAPLTLQHICIIYPANLT